MGRKAKYTKQEVFAAADAIVAEGREVAPTELHRQLGGGSFSTLYRHLEAWRAERAEANSPVLVAMPEPVRRALDLAWQAASTEAFREVARVREQAAMEVALVHRQFEEVLATIEQLEREAEADAGRIELLEAEARQLQETATLYRLQAEQSAGELERCRAALAGETGLREEVARLGGLGEARERELDRLQARLSAQEAREREGLAELATLRARAGAGKGMREAARSGKASAGQRTGEGA